MDQTNSYGLNPSLISLIETDLGRVPDRRRGRCWPRRRGPCRSRTGGQAGGGRDHDGGVGVGGALGEVVPLRRPELGEVIPLLPRLLVGQSGRRKIT